MNQSEIGETSCQDAVSKDGSVEITCFSDDLYETTVHFQIINLHKQVLLGSATSTPSLTRYLHTSFQNKNLTLVYYMDESDTQTPIFK